MNKNDDLLSWAAVMILMATFILGTWCGWLATHLNVVQSEYNRGYAEGKAFVYENDERLQEKGVRDE